MKKVIKQIAAALAIVAAIGGSTLAIRSEKPSSPTYLLDTKSIIIPTTVTGGDIGSTAIQQSKVGKKGITIGSSSQAWQQFTAQKGRGWLVRWNTITGTPHLVTGRTLVLPDGKKLTKKNIEAISRDFVAANVELLRIEPRQLRLANAVRASGRWYVSFQQIYNQLPVLGGQVNVSYTKDDKVIMFGSDVYPDVVSDTKPKVGQKEAMRLALDDCKVTSEKNRIGDVQICILPVRRPQDFDYILCWKLDIFQPAIQKKWEYLIDATDGKIVGKRNILVYEVSGTVEGEYKPEFASDPTQVAPFPYEDVSAQGPEVVIATWNFDNDPGWSTEGQWAFGTPTGGGSYCGDPNSGYTGSNVYGYNLNGDYSDNMPAYYLTTTPINCSGYENIYLTFMRWLGVESSYWDKAAVEVSNNGITWTTVWANSTNSICDGAWVPVTYDISTVADFQPTVYIRWSMGPTDSSVVYPGWNIDDVKIISILGGTNTIQTQTDGAYSVLPPWIPCIITSELRGLYCDINYECGRDGLFEQPNVGPDDVVNFTWNSDWYNEIVESSMYWHVNYVHDYYIAMDPSLSDSSTHYPSGLDYPMPVSVQMGCEDGYCNAYWDGEGMAFGAGDGLFCDDFGLHAEVVYHEYTHGVTSKIYDGVDLPYAMESGALNEAWSDYFGCALSPSQNPLVGDGGLLFDYPDGFRTLDNTYRRETDFSNSVHFDSQMVSGALWEARQAINGSVMDELVHFARYAHTTTFEDYLLAILVEDDTRYGDSNLTNGTPHGEVIYTAFGNHGIGGLQYIAASIVIDDSSGNMNGKLESGETVNVSLTLTNGWADATDISATLTTTDAFVTITKAGADFPDIYHGGVTDNETDPFVVSLDSSCPETHTINFVLEVTAKGPYSYSRTNLLTYAVAINQLAYDDGQVDSYIGVYGAGSGMAVRMTPENYPCYLTHIRFFPYEESTITATVWDDDGPGGSPGTVLGETDVSVSATGSWSDADISYLGLRIDSGSIYVGLVQHDTTYFSGIDNDPPYYEQSWVYISSFDNWVPFTNAGLLTNLMVRLRWSDEPLPLIEPPYEFTWSVGEPVFECLSAINGMAPYHNWVALTPSEYTYTLWSSLFSPYGTKQGWKADDGSWSYTLPFSFPYYNSNYSTVNISSNGFLDFASTSSDYYNTLTGLITNVRIAPLWDDLQTNINLDDDIYIDDSVSGQLMIRWQGMTYGAIEPVNFAVALFEDGCIRFDYDGGNSNLSPTVGISAGNGTDYLVIPGYNGSYSLTDAESVLLTTALGASSLPVGIELNPITGCLSGTPVSAGHYKATIQVTDSSLSPLSARHIFDFYVLRKDLQFAGFNIIEKNRIGRTIFRYVLSLSLTNTTDSNMTDVYVKLIDESEQVTAVIDSEIFFPLIEAGGTVDSNSFSDYFIIEVDRSKLITPGKLTWQVDYTKAGNSQMQLMSALLPIEISGALAGDINHNGKVDFEDLAELAEQWLQPPGIPSADIAPPNVDGIVNFLDFSKLAENW